MIHIRGHVRRVQAYLLAKDREGMTPEEVAQSEARVARVKAATGRHAKAPCGAGAGVAENAVLVGIERHRLAMPFNIRAGRIHIGKSALALDHLEVHQLTGDRKSTRLNSSH